ncbi:MAG: GvpL/GvpF family gas vesicle protein [Desulfobacter sp.]
MTWLAYAIFPAGPSAPAPESSRFPAGVDGAAVAFLKTGNLAVAVSRINGSEPPLGMEQVKQFHGVIQALFRNTVLIPMRYGCLFGTSQAILDMLAAPGHDYPGLLETLGGCAEMGIRIDLLRHPDGPPGTPASPSPESPQTGTAYLRTRQAHYHRTDTQDQADDNLIQQYAAPFTSLARHWYPEKKPGPPRRLSLFFLVPQHRVQRFTRIYTHTAADMTGSSFLSGPWPPYNFVTRESGLLPHSPGDITGIPGMFTPATPPGSPGYRNRP